MQRHATVLVVGAAARGEVGRPPHPAPARGKKEGGGVSRGGGCELECRQGNWAVLTHACLGLSAGEELVLLTVRSAVEVYFR